MTMLIPINANYRITSDSMNITVEKRRVTKEDGKARVAGEDYWVASAYFPNMQLAAKWLIDQQVRESGVTSLNEVISEIRKANDELIAAIKEYMGTVLAGR